MSEAEPPTTEMTTPEGDVVEIDTEIAPFIARLWKLDLMTLNSCQEPSATTTSALSEPSSTPARRKNHE
jgi:hypothetical protein